MNSTPPVSTHQTKLLLKAISQEQYVETKECLGTPKIVTEMDLNSIVFCAL